MLLTQVLQITIDSAAQALAEQPTEEKLSIIELLLKGGWILIPLFVMSIIAIYIFVERYLTIKRASKEEKNFMTQIREYVLQGNIDAAKTLCKGSDNPIARMIEKGLSRVGRPLKDINVAIENTGKIEIFKLENNLAGLATISGAAPMIGFFGTVIGMIKAFFNMSKAGNNIEVGLLAGGIYEAMITTAAGLVVGIIAFIGYNILVTMIEKVIYKMETSSLEFVDLLQDPA
ncbi:MAG: biopolymer transport protein ExbB [Sphingobacteriales bacterium]|jgi:biopolymer transport protein ExbB